MAIHAYAFIFPLRLFLQEKDDFMSPSAAADIAICIHLAMYYKHIAMYACIAITLFL